MKSGQGVRRLAAILMADMVGYSRLMGADDVQTVAAMRRHRRMVIQPLVDGYHGRLVNAPGDSLLVEFPSVVQAVACALAIQTRAFARLPDEPEIVYRIGINIGDVLVDKGEIFGDGVNVAARLEALAEPGGICLSRAAFEQVRHAIKADFVARGLQPMKNILAPVEVYALPAEVVRALPTTVEAGSPLAPTSRVAPKAMLVAGTACAVLAVAVGMSHSGLKKEQALDFEAVLDQELAKMLPNTDSRARSKTIAGYKTSKVYRALAIAPKAQSRLYSGNWESEIEAEERTLERCQIAFGEPCTVIAVDDALSGKRSQGPRDMPRARYAGAFDPDRIPGIRSTMARSRDVATYGAVSGPKAMAYNVRGLVMAATGASTQGEAEIRALDACRAQVKNRDFADPCFIYATQNDVVLAERRTSPRKAP